MRAPPAVRWAAAGVFLLWGAACALPLLWAFATALKPSAEVLRAPLAPPDWGAPQWGNFAEAWSVGRLGPAWLHSLAVTAVAVGLIVLLGARAAFALARLEFPGRARWEGLFLLALAAPAQLAVIPLFFQLRAVGLLGTLPGLVLVYVANGLPFAVFVLTPFFRHVSASLHEAARLDGADEGTAFRRIFLPLAAPGLAVVAVVQAIAVWREYFFAFFVLSGAGVDGPETLPLGLTNLSVRAVYTNAWGALFAGLALAVLPLLAFYLVAQGALRKGLALGAVKG